MQLLIMHKETISPGILAQNQCSLFPAFTFDHLAPAPAATAARPAALIFRLTGLEMAAGSAAVVGLAALYFFHRNCCAALILALWAGLIVRLPGSED